MIYIGAAPHNPVQFKALVQIEFLTTTKEAFAGIVDPTASKNNVHPAAAFKLLVVVGFVVKASV